MTSERRFHFAFHLFEADWSRRSVSSVPAERHVGQAIIAGSVLSSLEL